MIDELKKSDPNYNNRTFADLNFIMHVVAYRWFVGKNKETGMDEEAKEAFSLFDKNKRGYAS
jgi:Ca2+-binding EF-hand superfamily protein